MKTKNLLFMALSAVILSAAFVLGAHAAVLNVIIPPNIQTGIMYAPDYSNSYQMGLNAGTYNVTKNIKVGGYNFTVGTEAIVGKLKIRGGEQTDVFRFLCPPKIPTEDSDVFMYNCTFFSNDANWTKAGFISFTRYLTSDGSNYGTAVGTINIIAEGGWTSPSGKLTIPKGTYNLLLSGYGG